LEGQSSPGGITLSLPCGAQKRQNPAREVNSFSVGTRIDDWEQMSKRQLLGIVGSTLLFIGVFLPIVKLPIVGDVNYFANGRGYGVLVLLLAVTSFVLVLLKWYRELWITSLGSAVILAFTFFNLQSKVSEMKGKVETELKDNPFRGLADLAVQSVQLQWGWAVLVIAVVMLIVAAAMKDTPPDWSR
jgi:hypothetical protein